jgi:hypothetical protein
MIASCPPVHVIHGSLPFTAQVMTKSLPEQFELTFGQETVPGDITWRESRLGEE